MGELIDDWGIKVYVFYVPRFDEIYFCYDKNLKKIKIKTGGRPVICKIYLLGEY